MFSSHVEKLRLLVESLYGLFLGDVLDASIVFAHCAIFLLLKMNMKTEVKFRLFKQGMTALSA